VSDNGIVFDATDAYPDFLIDEFLTFLANVLEGQGGAHIDAIVQQLTEKLRSPYLIDRRKGFYGKALGVITQARAQEPSS